MPRPPHIVRIAQLRHLNYLMGKLIEAGKKAGLQKHASGKIAQAERDFGESKANIRKLTAGLSPEEKAEIRKEWCRLRAKTPWVKKANVAASIRYQKTKKGKSAIKSTGQGRWEK